MTDRSVTWRSNLIFLAAPVLVAAILFYRLLSGEALFWGLPALQFIPWRTFATSELLSGRLPFWNWHVGAGASLLANYQSAIFYPLHWLYLLTPGAVGTARMLGLIGVVHILIAAFGSFRLVRHWNKSAFATAIAALSYPFCTVLIARFGTPPMLTAAAWLPWLLLAADRLIDRPTIRRGVQFAFIAALLLLAGHAQWAFYCLVLCGLYVLARLIAERRPAHLLIGFALAGALAIGLSAMQLVPTLELQRLSQRADRVDPRIALNFSLAPIALPTLIAPDFLGSPARSAYAVFGAYFETTAYIGLLPLILALFGFGRILRRRADWRTVLFAVIAVVGILLALGFYTPIYPFLYESIPTFNLFQAPARWLLLTAFSLSMMAAITADQWTSTIKTRKRSWVFVNYTTGFSILMVMGAIGIAVAYAADERGVPTVVAAVIASLLITMVKLVVVAFASHRMPPREQPRALYVWSVVVVALIGVDLIFTNWGHNPTIPADFYRPQLEAAERIPYGRTIGLTYLTARYEKQIRDRHLNFQDYPAIYNSSDEYRSSGLPNLSMIDYRYMLNNFDPLLPAWYEETIRELESLTADGDPDLIRAFMLRHHVWEVRDTTDTAEVIIQADGSRVYMAETGLPPPAYTLTDVSPLEVRIELTDAPAGTLVLADTDYPGWIATLNGVEVPIQRVEGMLRGVSIPEGSGTLVFSYQPRSVQIGLWVTLASVLAAIGLVVIRRVPPASPDRERDSGSLRP